MGNAARKEKDPFDKTANGAELSPDGQYRYLLWRAIDGEHSGRRLLWVMLNPSTADASVDDATIRRCRGYAKNWGFSGIEVVNLFAYRATDPKELTAAADPVGRINDIFIAQAARRADKIVCAWGGGVANGPAGRDRAVIELLVAKLGKPLYTLGTTALGHPKHPVRLPKDLEPEVWMVPEPEPIKAQSMGAVTAVHKCPICGDDQKRIDSGLVCSAGHGFGHDEIPVSEDNPFKDAWISMVPADQVLDPNCVVKVQENAPVYDQRGVQVGEVKSVERTPDGLYATAQLQPGVLPEPKSLSVGVEIPPGFVSAGEAARAFSPDYFAPIEPPPEEPEPFTGLAPEPPEWDPSKDQARALEQITEWWSKERQGTRTLGGYAGSGKSFLTGKLAYDLLSADERVVFATPTGKAAQVLERSLRRSGVLSANVSTIHGLIYIPKTDPLTGRVKGWKRRESLFADLIVLDEASMVTRQMLDDLEHFGVPILAVGDHGQLPPVGETAHLMEDPDFTLTKIHRQAKGNPIIRLATIIRNGAPNAAVKQLIRDLDDERIQMGSAEEAKAFGAPPGMCITYTNRTRTDLNNEIRYDAYGYDDETDPQPGEIVICLKNHRLDEGESMIANGMRGVVKGCREDEKSTHIYRMDIEFDEPVGLVENLRVNKHQFLREKTFKGFDEVPGQHTNWWSVGALFDFGYALTCHKAQGSQADNVSVFMEWSLGRMSDDDQRRWRYTAVTRAAERIMLVF